MRKNLIFAAAAAVAILSGCAKEVLTDNSSKNVLAPEDAIRFTATVEEAVSTRGVLENKLFKWEVGDEISVSDGTTQAIYAVSEVSEDNVATFLKKEGEADLAAGASYEAWYPAVLAEGAIPYDQLLTTVGEENVNDTEPAYNCNPMHAAETSGSVLEFKNLCGMVHFHMSCPDSPKVALKTITVTADKALTGVFTLDGDKAVVTDGGNCSSRCYLANAKWLNTVHEFYLALPEGEYSKFDITVTSNTNSSETISLKSDKTVTITRNVINLIEINLDSYWNLGRKETANCYIAPDKSGYYKFKPTKGCSSESVGTVASAKVIWEASGSSNAPSAGAIVKGVTYDSASGFIKFQRGGSQGSAIVAACDASGNVLWSWYIWCTNTVPADQTYPNGKQIMDRSMGTFANSWTLSSDRTYQTSVTAAGMLYQWGRKDPFPGRGAQNNTTTVALTGTQMTVNTSGPVSIATAYAHPAVYYANSSNVWTTEGATWDGEHKTIHDPCPPGYRVWDNTAWGDPINKSDFAVHPMAANASGSIVNMGYTFHLGDGTTAFYATNGQYNQATGGFSAAMNQCRTWYRTVKDNNVGFYNLTHSGSGSSIALSAASQSHSFGIDSAYGMAVRCERITE